MFEYFPGTDIVEEESDLIVNTVNTVGVMGKGVALAFREKFPAIMPSYQEACASRRLQPGAFQIIPLEDGRSVLNLATKEHWRDPSKPEWIGSGFLLLARYLELFPDRFRSISMPPPGCGNGGLHWDRVHQTALSCLTPASEKGMRIRFLAERPDPVEEPVMVAGIGARKTPEDIQQLMTGVSERFSENRWRLRSGGAIGADSAFGKGAVTGGDPGEIYLAEKKDDIPGGIFDIRPVHLKSVAAFHPKPDRLSSSGTALMARNVCQLFGADMTVASKLLICWTEDGKIKGGTGQALRMAGCVGIPVINLGRPDLRGIGVDDIIGMGRDMIASREKSMAVPDPAGADPSPG